MTELDNILEHYGIKGMHWGVRKADSSNGHGPTGGTKTPVAVSEDHARATNIHSRISADGTKVVSNKELQDVIQRMNLEQQYSRLTSTKTSTLAAGHNKVKNIIGYGKTLQEIHSLATGGLAKAVSAAIKEASKGK